MHCYAPNFEEVEGANWFGPVHLSINLPVLPSACLNPPYLTLLHKISQNSALHCEIKSHRIQRIWKLNPWRIFKSHRTSRWIYKRFHEKVNINHYLLANWFGTVPLSIPPPVQKKKIKKIFFFLDLDSLWKKFLGWRSRSHLKGKW